MNKKTLSRKQKQFIPFFDDEGYPLWPGSEVTVHTPTDTFVTVLKDWSSDFSIVYLEADGEDAKAFKFEEEVTGIRATDYTKFRGKALGDPSYDVYEETMYRFEKVLDFEPYCRLRSRSRFNLFYEFEDGAVKKVVIPVNEFYEQVHDWLTSSDTFGDYALNLKVFVDCVRHR